MNHNVLKSWNMNMQYSNHEEWDEAAPVNLENCHEILWQLDCMLEEERRLEKKYVL